MNKQVNKYVRRWSYKNMVQIYKILDWYIPG